LTSRHAYWHLVKPSYDMAAAGHSLHCQLQQLAGALSTAACSALLASCGLARPIPLIILRHPLQMKPVSA
jgi:hypothetical protein